MARTPAAYEIRPRTEVLSDLRAAVARLAGLIGDKKPEQYPAKGLLMLHSED